MTKRKANPETAELLRLLRDDIEACPEAIAWVAQNAEFSPKELYQACNRADWLWWFLDELFWPTDKRVGYPDDANGRYIAMESGLVFDYDGLVGEREAAAVHKAACKAYRKRFPFAKVAAQLKVDFPR